MCITHAVRIAFFHFESNQIE